MKTQKAFTLVELLVVISIIALLLAMLMPALNLAKEQARSTACLSMIRSYGMANDVYASANEGWYVPFSQPHSDSSLSWDERWCENKEYRKKITVASRVRIEDSGWNDAFMYPKALRCPSQNIRDEDAYTAKIEALEGWKVIISYGYNVEAWRFSGNLANPTTWWPRGGYYGHNQGNVKTPSESMMFIDNNYYQARYERSNPRYWNTFGDTIETQNLGQTCYRHNKKANVCFFDGHTGSLKIDEVWDKNNAPPPFNVNLRKPNKLWDVSKKSTIGLKH